ncbi:MAG TPA: endonuclease domain-containing protein [Methylomirabilota bacterium]|jgi:very-short-patch-repair endonuclease|nr:endonuclease domain-containing protein [Methylomirabilota bacterium]
MRQHRPELSQHARGMRHVATDAEMRLWSRLRGRRLAGRKFRRQHPLCGFILDFYCAEAGIAIELDGGGHAMSEQAGYDQERERQLSQNGIRVLRFWDDQALKETDTVLEIIAAALETALTLPSPPKAERGSHLLS